MRPDIDAIEARANAATPGPWTRKPYGREEVCHRCEPFAHYDSIDCPNADASRWDGAVITTGHVAEDDALNIRPADAAFIAHAREDIPALIAYARELEEQVRYWESMYLHAGSGW